jgi:hypothetical protein
MQRFRPDQIFAHPFRKWTRVRKVNPAPLHAFVAFLPEGEDGRRVLLHAPSKSEARALLKKQEGLQTTAGIPVLRALA